MDTETQLRQLVEARELAMNNSPQQMLPKVLETADTLAAGEFKQHTSGDNGIHAPIGIFFAQLLRDILDHPAVPTSELPFIASRHIDTLVLLLGQQSSASANAILAFAAVYPLLFDLVAKTSDVQLWTKLCNAKSGIVSQWRAYAAGLMTSGDNYETHNTACRLALAKCMSQCIIVQTNKPTGTNTTSNSSNNHNSPHGNYIYSINLLSVPDGHPVINNKAALDKESKQMLDMLLGFLVDEPMMVASVFIGVINTLAFIMKERPQTTQRILGGMLKFNVDAKYQPENVSALNYRLAKRYVERCYRNFVQFGTRNDIIKNAPPTAQQYSKLSKIAQTLFVIGEESKSKGILNFDPAQVERKVPEPEKQRITAYRARLREKIGIPAQQAAPASQEPSRSPSVAAPSQPAAPLPPSLTSLQEYVRSKSAVTGFVNTSPVASSNTYSAIFSLMNSEDSHQDMSMLPQDTLTKLCSEALLRTPTANLISGLSIVASRYTDLMAKATSSAGSTTSTNSASTSTTATQGTKRSNEEQESSETPEPKKTKTETSAEIKSESQSNEDKDDGETEVDADEAIDNDDFDLTKLLGKPQPMSEEQKLATAKRIIGHFMSIKDEAVNPSLQVASNSGSPLDQARLVNWKNSESWYLILIRLATRGTAPSSAISDLIRNELLSYILADFENNISIVIDWLNEEWYSSTILNTDRPAEGEQDNYTKWSLRVLEDLIPFMENQHRRIFIRLMSELPKLELAHFERIKPILLDPGRSALGFQTLKFLIMFRSPVKQTIKTLLEQVISDDKSLEEQCRPILDKYYS